MTEGERLELLVRELCSNNQAEFSRAVGIPPTVINKIIRGLAEKEGVALREKYVARICSAFPSVNVEWLRTGKGLPGPISTYYIREERAKEVEELNKEIAFLKEQLAVMQKMLEKLLKQ